MQYKLIGDNNTNDIITTVLKNRGIGSPKKYLNLDESVVQDYNCLNNMREAVECFVNHYENKNKIVIMPDEDCDGYTSSAMLYLYIKALDSDYPVEYIMHSEPKMHGLANGEYLKIPKDTKLFIMADGGTNDTFEFNELIKSGIDCIILDHHDADYQDESQEENIQSAEINNAIIVNNQLSDNYFNKNLSGAGIVYRFLQALDEELWEDYADNFLDLCAVGNVADLMDIRSFETRYFVNQGINNFNNSFLKALAKAQEFSTKGRITIHNIAWYFSPVINSITRIGTLEERELVFRAMIEQDETFVYDKRGHGLVEENIYDRAARIAKNAKSRQDKQRDKVYNELKGKIDPNDKIVILESKIATSGLVGLSAMKLAEFAQRAVIIVKEIEKDGEKILSGSCRNFDGSPIADLKKLILISNKFEFCSGHSNAAGLAIKPQNIKAAKEWFECYLQTVDFNNPIPCDFVLDIDELTIPFIHDINKYDWLWGTGLKEPKVAVENITIKRSDIHIQGKNFNSVTFTINDIKFVQFNMAEDNPLLEWASAWDGDDNDTIRLNVVGEVGINEYKGIYTPQVNIKDFTIQN
jgi:single-stranded-DNA-specific exonuclease